VDGSFTSTGCPVTNTLGMITEPCLEAIKYLREEPKDLGGGNWLFEYSIEIMNCGGTDIDSIQITDNLSEVFQNTDTFYLQSFPSASGLTDMPYFNGVDKTNLLAGYQTLKPNEIGTISFNVIVQLSEGSDTSFVNKAIAQAITPDGELLTDTSYTDTAIIENALLTSRVDVYAKNCKGDPICGIFGSAAGGGNGQSAKLNEDLDDNGIIEFVVFKDYDWLFKIHYQDSYLNGVTMKDYNLLLNHVLGREFIKNPYKLVAADVNGDGQINIQDVLMLRRLIQGTIIEIPNQLSWQFIDATYDFPGITNTDLPNIIYDIANKVAITPVTNDFYAINFIGVKIGDIDGDVVLCN